MKKDVHVIKDENAKGWVVQVGDNKHFSGKYSTQKEAIAHGRELGRRHHTELVVHGRDGKIRDKYSYGNDPRDIKG